MKKITSLIQEHNYSLADCGEILPFQRNEEEKKKKFIDCCGDTLSLLRKLYRCPFSANTKSQAIPLNKDDQVDLSDNEISNEDLKIKIKNVVYDKDYITACNFVTVEITL